jgi:hypothetical protein
VDARHGPTLVAHFIASGPLGRGRSMDDAKICKISNVILEYKIRPFPKDNTLKNKEKIINP